MNSFTKHITLPAIAPAAVIALYFTPVSLFGCANRGLMALAVVLASLVAGIIAAVLALKARARKDAAAGRWIASAIIFALPALLVLGPLR